MEFGAFKAKLRQWIDTHLDHGSMLSDDDPLTPILQAHGCKVWVMSGSWPTVENVAELIADIAQVFLSELTRAPGAKVTQVRVTETHVNEAAWTAG